MTMMPELETTLMEKLASRKVSRGGSSENGESSWAALKREKQWGEMS
jgi:hypothetical protein